MCDQCYLPKAAGDMNSVYLLSNDFLFMQDVPAQGGFHCVTHVNNPIAC